MRRVTVTEFAFSKSVHKPLPLRALPRRNVRRFGAEWEERGFAELYDLEADPWEQENLALLRSTAPRWRRLRAELIDWLVTTTRPTTVLRLPEAAGPSASCTTTARSTATASSPGCVAELTILNYL